MSRAGIRPGGGAPRAALATLWLLAGLSACDSSDSSASTRCEARLGALERSAGALAELAAPPDAPLDLPIAPRPAGLSGARVAALPSEMPILAVSPQEVRFEDRGVGGLDDDGAALALASDLRLARSVALGPSPEDGSRERVDWPVALWVAPEVSVSALTRLLSLAPPGVSFRLLVRGPRAADPRARDARDPSRAGDAPGEGEAGDAPGEGEAGDRAEDEAGDEAGDDPAVGGDVPDPGTPTGGGTGGTPSEPRVVARRFEGTRDRLLSTRAARRAREFDEALASCAPARDIASEWISADARSDRAPLGPLLAAIRGCRCARPIDHERLLGLLAEELHGADGPLAMLTPALRFGPTVDGARGLTAEGTVRELAVRLARAGGAASYAVRLP